METRLALLLRRFLPKKFPLTKDEPRGLPVSPDSRKVREGGYLSFADLPGYFVFQKSSWYDNEYGVPSFNPATEH
jgi:hypothetical protein